MPPVTNKMLNGRREKDCFAITPDRKYYHTGNSFIKRSLRPSEWQHGCSGYLHIPRYGNERILNEAAALGFIAEKTSIPVPKVHACFEDDGAAYLVVEYIDGVSMSDLDDEQRKIVGVEIEGHLRELSSLKSESWGGPSGIVIPPYRVLKSSVWPEWKMRPRATQDLVFCHNDLSMQNIIVDPDTLKIKAIIDWEYAGFFPPEFETKFFLRLGPSTALPGEVDDANKIAAIMHQNKLL